MAVGCSTKSIPRLIARTQDMRPRVQLRSQLRLSLGEREEISRGRLAGKSMRMIATLLGRSASTVSREVGANGGHHRRGRFTGPLPATII